eukprot:g3318.t1
MHPHKRLPSNAGFTESNDMMLLPNKKFETLRMLRVKQNMEALDGKGKTALCKKTTKRAKTKITKTPISLKDFCNAAKRGDTPYIHVAITQYGNDVNCRDPIHNRSLLHWACIGGRLSLARYLITECHLSTETRDIAKCTPLLCAIQGCHLKLVKYLLTKTHANLAVVDKDKRGPLHHACRSGNFRVLRFLLKAEHARCEMKAKELLKDEEKETIDVAQDSLPRQKEPQVKPVNRVDRNGWSPLFWSCKQGYIEISRYLLENESANALIRDRSNATLLHHVSRTGGTKMLTFLLEKNLIDINVQDDKGYTPLLCALRSGQMEMAQILLCAGADVNVKTKKGETVLQLAALYCDFIVLRDASNVMKPLGDVSEDTLRKALGFTEQIVKELREFSIPNALQRKENSPISNTSMNNLDPLFNTSERSKVSYDRSDNFENFLEMKKMKKGKNGGSNSNSEIHPHRNFNLKEKAKHEEDSEQTTKKMTHQQWVRNTLRKRKKRKDENERQLLLQIAKRKLKTEKRSKQEKLTSEGSENGKEKEGEGTEKLLILNDDKIIHTGKTLKLFGESGTAFTDWQAKPPLNVDNEDTDSN